MSVAAPSLLHFESTYARDLQDLVLPWQAAEAPAPRLVSLNAELAAELGVDPEALRTPEGIGLLTGARIPAGVTPVAQVYAGHQFGNWSPRLGDGRALLLGEVIDVRGRRRDIHLKGSGRTPFARGGDGKAVVGPMLREHVISEAMHALGIPTTRALAVVATGEQVSRGMPQPGALLVRVAASHLRVGTFQYAFAGGDRALLRRLADHAIARHHPEALKAGDPYLGLFEAVVEAQASLLARWMHVGFVHGVMNTDNMTISGETIDYGPCAFVDAHDPRTVFSSIDQGGRYAFGNQPHLAQWNLARLAETLLPLIDADQDAAVAAATAVLEGYPDRYQAHFDAGMRAKLGLAEARDGDAELAGELLGLMAAQRADHTGTLRALSTAVRGNPGPLRGQVVDALPAIDAWTSRWLQRLGAEGGEPDAVAAAMDRVNPAFVPRNHKVEEALTAATAGDTGPFHRLLAVLADPFTDRPGLEAYGEPAPPEFGGYQTFCGT